ncbi:MAG TPA: TauD/TfdA family dioxygenase [Gammaproteobacteria bacterium]|nr:TauD/TfdA family dioxygenase [Gammaproteobacteria bacterium]
MRMTPPSKPIAYLDCSDEVSALRESGSGRMRWLADDIERADWVVEMTPGALAEIDRLAGFLQQNPLPILQRRLNEFELPACHQVMAQLKNILDNGVGFAVLERLPMDAWPIEVLLEIYWLLGQCIGRPVAQKWNGQMIYDVSDTGADYAYGTRGSYTSVELNFHTDNAFARMLPDYVGLFCRHPAKTGGISRLCSLYSVHQRMLERYPDELARLYQPVFFDRQKEHHEDAAKVCFAPYFSWRGGRMFARANASLIRKGYQVAEEKMDSLLSAALDAIDEVCAAEDLWFEAPLQRGQVQYLNNHEIGHYRSAFEDYDDPARKRHLYRLWHRESGDSSYDGQHFS